MAPALPVVAVAGLACETSTFSPARSDAAAFHPKTGADALALYPFLREKSHPVAAAADWRGALIGRALPGGAVLRDAYEELAGGIVSQLQAIVSSVPQLDGLWFDIHGAMEVVGLDDAEADLLRRVRAVVGPDVLVSASMDLHGNVSRALAHQLDLVTCYRMAPHEDELDTKERACRNLLSCLTGKEPGRRPIKAWVPVPILLPGEQTSTRDEPAKTIYAAVPKVEALPGILDAAIWVGYAWADGPRNRAAVVVTGWDTEAVAAGAERLARLFWQSRADFHFVAPTGSLDECLDAALAAPPEKRPYFVSDSGDNPTAGGAGDVTWTLAKLLARPEFAPDQQRGDAVGDSKEGVAPPPPPPKTVIYASLPGPEAVRTAVATGVGKVVTVTAGAAVDDVHAGPVTLTGIVHSIKHGDKWARTEVALKVVCGPGGETSIYVILTELRKPYHKERDFTDLDLQPRQADIVLVKIGYLEPELYAMAADWMLALTPGGVDQDLPRLGHHRIRRPMWPFDRDFPAPPDLSARIIPLSTDELTGPDE